MGAQVAFPGQGVKRRIAQGQVDRHHVVAAGVGHHPVERLHDVGAGAGAVIAQHAQGNDVDLGRDAQVVGVRRAHRAGHVRAVSVDIAGIVVVGAYEVVIENNAVRNTVVVGIGAEVRMVQVNARVDDDHRHALAFQGVKARVCMKSGDVGGQTKVGIQDARGRRTDGGLDHLAFFHCA